MDFEQYKALLHKRLECYFNITESVQFGAHTYALSAEFFTRENQTLLSQKQVMDYLDTKERCLVLPVNDVSQINQILTSLPAAAVTYSGELSRHHKATTVTVVFVELAGMSAEEVKAVKRFYFHKLHRFGFWGVTDACAILVDLEGDGIVCGRGTFGKKKVFVPVEKQV